MSSAATSEKPGNTTACPSPRIGCLRVRGVSRHFAPHAGGTPAVDNVSFEVAPGSIAALVGESGAGKSTLLRLIAGLETPDSGEISLGNRLLSAGGKQGANDAQVVPPERRDIGLVFQNHALFPHLTVFDNITFGLAKRPMAERRAEAERLLALVRLPGCERRMPHELSGGERQRIALARTLAPRPSLVLLDEPFSSLDASLKMQVREEVRAILREAGVTTLIVTHDTGDALALADRIIIIRHGRILQSDTPENLHRHPASREVAAFFGPCNFLPAPAFPTLPPNATGEVWLRPSSLKIVGADEASSLGNPVGHVTACRFYGTHYEVRIRPADTKLPEIFVHAPAPISVGTENTVGLLPA